MKPAKLFSSILRQFFLVSMFFMVLTSVASAQCIESNFQTQNVTTGNHPSVGQSFRASCSGSILSISLEWREPITFLNSGNTNDRVLNIYDGGSCTAPLLHTQIIPYNSILVGINTFVVTSPVPINSNEVNFFEITDTGRNPNSADGVGFATSGTYGGGGALHACGANPGFDLNFSVEIGSPPPSTVPTLTEWGLIILSFVVLAIGAAAVFKKRKKYVRV